jgi:hypothetical protein
MPPAVAVHGRIGRLIAGASAIEVKAVVPLAQMERGLAHFGLTADNDQQRYIYFFDTPEFDLFDAGLIARARRVVGGQHDSTVKVRPVDPDQVAGKWRRHPGFKLEADATADKVVRSASLTAPVKRGWIKKVAAGGRDVADLFTEEQERFLTHMANHSIDYARVTTRGPIRVWRWQTVHEALPWRMTVELWERGDGDRMLEVSAKAPHTQAAAAGAGFFAFLAEVGAERTTQQEAKTHWAMGRS